MTKSSLSFASSRVKKRKDGVRELLLQRKILEIVQWYGNDKNILRTLSSFLYESDKLLLWRTIEALGKVAVSVGERDMEALRRLIRQLLWGMNDESGSIGWHSPEAIGEILFNVPKLIDEYLPILVSNLETEPFGAGICKAMARIACRYPDKVRRYEKELKRLLKSPDIREAAMAIVAIKEAGLGLLLDELSGDIKDAKIEYYDFDEGALKVAVLTQMIGIKA